MIPCQICGNDVQPGTSVCPYCGSRQEPTGKPGKKPFKRKVVNLEQGLPSAEDAVRRLERALAEARMEKVRVLTVIHGYGSSGKGGKIRTECRKTLDYLCSRGRLGGFVPGEEFRHRDGRTKSLLQRFPQLENDRNLDRGNRGITLVVL